MYGTGKGRHTHNYYCVGKDDFSPTVQRNYMEFGVIEASISVSVRLNLGLCILFGFGVISVSLWPHANGKGRPYTRVCANSYFSITAQRDRIKLGRLVAPDSGCLHPISWHCSSFRIGAGYIQMYSG